MSDLLTPVSALGAAQTRFQRAGETLMRSVSGDDGAGAVTEMIRARHEAQAAVQVVRFSDELFKALIEIAR